MTHGSPPPTHVTSLCCCSSLPSCGSSVCSAQGPLDRLGSSVLQDSRARPFPPVFPLGGGQASTFVPSFLVFLSHLQTEPLSADAHKGSQFPEFLDYWCLHVHTKQRHASGILLTMMLGQSNHAWPMDSGTYLQRLGFCVISHYTPTKIEAWQMQVGCD